MKKSSKTQLFMAIIAMTVIIMVAIAVAITVFRFYSLYTLVESVILAIAVFFGIIGWFKFITCFYVKNGNNVQGI